MIRKNWAVMGLAVLVAGCSGGIEGTYVAAKEGVQIRKDAGALYITMTPFEGREAYQSQTFLLEKKSPVFTFQLPRMFLGAVTADAATTDKGLRILVDGESHDYVRVDPKAGRPKWDGDRIVGAIAKNFAGAWAKLASEGTCEAGDAWGGSYRLAANKARHLKTIVPLAKIGLKSYKPANGNFFLIGAVAEGTIALPAATTEIDDFPVCLAQRERQFFNSEADRYECGKWGKRPGTLSSAEVVLPFRVTIAGERFPEVMGDNVEVLWTRIGDADRLSLGRFFCGFLDRKSAAFAATAR